MTITITHTIELILNVGFYYKLAMMYVRKISLKLFKGYEVNRM